MRRFVRVCVRVRRWKMLPESEREKHNTNLFTTLNYDNGAPGAGAGPQVLGRAGHQPHIQSTGTTTAAIARYAGPLKHGVAFVFSTAASIS